MNSPYIKHYHEKSVFKHYTPDGLYTAPTYEAMVYDVDKTKDW